MDRTVHCQTAMTENDRPEEHRRKDANEGPPEQEAAKGGASPQDDRHPSKQVHKHTAEELHGPAAEHD